MQQKQKRSLLSQNETILQLLKTLIAVSRYSQLVEHFPMCDEITGVEIVTPNLVPVNYCTLLHHKHHMTVTLEDFFRDKVDVEVLDWDRIDSFYVRKIILSLGKTKRAVQFGVVKINLSFVPESIRKDIVEGKIPLGRILIENKVLTTVEPVEILKVSLGPQLTQRLNCDFPMTTFGRIGLITANGQPAIEVLEVLAPLPEHAIHTD